MRCVERYGFSVGRVSYEPMTLAQRVMFCAYGWQSKQTATRILRQNAEIMKKFLRGEDV